MNDLHERVTQSQAKHRLSVAVVGLGNIGMGYDMDQPVGGRIMTHARAASVHPDFQLVAGVDPDPEKRAILAQRYGVPAYGDVGGMLGSERPDVVAIGVPTALHARVLTEVLQGKPLVVICEKPLAVKLADARAMVAAADEAGISLLVNYIRRFDPGVAKLGTLLASGDLGKPIRGVVWYDRGFKENGIHFLNLLEYLLGDGSDVKMLALRGRWDTGDLLIDAVIRFGDAEMSFLATGRGDTYASGFDLITEGAIVRYHHLGHRIQIERKQDCNRGFSVEEIEGGLQKYQWHVMDVLSQHLSLGRPLPSDGISALQSETIAERLIVKTGLDHD